MLSVNELKLKLKYVKDKGHFPKGMTGKEIGQLLDFSNQTIDKANEKVYGDEIRARNKYFVKLFLWKLEHERDSYKSSSILISKKVGEN